MARKIWEDDKKWYFNSPRSVHCAYDILKDGRWAFNGDYDNPTFEPSINESWTLRDGVLNRNHYFVRNGQIQYLGDCTHEYAGQTLNIPPMTEVQIMLYGGDDVVSTI